MFDNIIGTARQVGYAEARAHFAAGGKVLVSVNGEREFDVYASHVTHSWPDTSWSQLRQTVKSYGDARQRYYVMQRRLYAVKVDGACVVTGPARGEGDAEHWKGMADIYRDINPRSTVEIVQIR